MKKLIHQQAANYLGGTKRTPNAALAKSLFMSFFRAKQYREALGVLRPLMATGRCPAGVYHDAAVAAIALESWQEAVGYARRAVALAPGKFMHFDALSHAAGALKDWKTVQRAGHQALTLRDASVSSHPPVALPLKPVNPAADVDLISFSLFGGDSKYCETAILNCLEQPVVYPGWRCRFYVDGSVPVGVLRRIEEAGGEVVVIDAAMKAWPGPMWRFAALDDDRVRRVIFRDADSVISSREAGAVAQWVERGSSFHVMRDSGTHTELLLAGLWGARAGALPSMRSMIDAFLTRPVEDAHFADQSFLRHFVWPFARQDILQHDSLFEFLEGLPFPEGPHRDDFHTGYAEGSPIVTITTKQAEGLTVSWCLMDMRVTPHKLVCRYQATVVGGCIRANVPARYARLLGTKEMSAFVELSPQGVQSDSDSNVGNLNLKST